MSWRYVLANLAAGNQPLSILDQMFNDAGALTATQATASGTNTITLTPNSFTPPVTAYANLQTFGFTAQNNSTAAVTLQIAAIGLLPLYIPGGTRQAASGDVSAGTYYQIVFLQSLNSGGGGFIIVSERGTTEAMVSAVITGGTATIQKQINVASVVCSGSGTGVGSYQINFTNPMADATYVPAISYRGIGGKQIQVQLGVATARTQNSMVVTAVDVVASATADVQELYVLIKD